MGFIIRLSVMVLLLMALPAFSQSSMRAVKQTAKANPSKSPFVYSAQFDLLLGESKLFDLIPRGGSFNRYYFSRASTTSSVANWWAIRAWSSR